MIAALDGLRFLRVLPPFARTPVGLHGCRPPAVRPSPPPIGWLTGFIDVPRLCGLRPMCRLRPALPRLMFMCSALLIMPSDVAGVGVGLGDAQISRAAR